MDLYQICTNNAPGVKIWPAPRGHMFNLGLHRENIFILYKTTRPIFLIIGMKHNLVDLNQVCSNYAPGAKHYKDSCERSRSHGASFRGGGGVFCFVCVSFSELTLQLILS